MKLCGMSILAVSRIFGSDQTCWLSLIVKNDYMSLIVKNDYFLESILRK